MDHSFLSLLDLDLEIQNTNPDPDSYPDPDPSVRSVQCTTFLNDQLKYIKNGSFYLL
jgi:hypothetical protein